MKVCLWSLFSFATENQRGWKNAWGTKMLCVCDGAWLYIKTEYTYIVAPGEDRAPLRGDASACGAVDTWPGLVGVYGDDGGTVRVAWGSRRLRATWKGQGSCVHGKSEEWCFTAFHVGETALPTANSHLFHTYPVNLTLIQFKCIQTPWLSKSQHKPGLCYKRSYWWWLLT